MNYAWMQIRRDDRRRSCHCDEIVAAAIRPNHRTRFWSVGCPRGPYVAQRVPSANTPAGCQKTIRIDRRITDSGRSAYFDKLYLQVNVSCISMLIRLSVVWTFKRSFCGNSRTAYRTRRPIIPSLLRLRRPRNAPGADSSRSETNPRAVRDPGERPHPQLPEI